jgi:hypothetical protein
MGLILGVRAFFKALREPEKAQEFVDDKPKEVPAVEFTDKSHLRLLTMLQQSSRLVDFLMEDIAAYDDAQVGAAVRKIHEDSRQCLEELVTIRSVIDENEGATITVPRGYDPIKLKVVGHVRGEPPFVGVVIHKGWEAHKSSLPQKVGKQLGKVISPAEIEVS